MTLDQALSLHPDTVVLEADEQSYQGVFKRILASLQGISDRVESSDLGMPTFDWTGWRRCTEGRPDW